ncbi:hypothetical protein [Leifsonia sp. NPDC080035]|uniref:Uncharacterized protein n=1 Tax=Leifsonia sp. NPDC080035 TaxID=3143936 RepID=A0AAU7GCC1_9MICO
MTIHIKPPQRKWELSRGTYFSFDSAQTRPNVRPIYFSSNQGHPNPQVRPVYGVENDRLLVARTEGHVYNGRRELDGYTYFDRLPTGNRAVFQPYHFALDGNYNFANNKVFFLLRDGLAYWLTEQQAVRYLKGESLTISGSKKKIQLDDAQAELTLFDGIDGDWEL